MEISFAEAYGWLIEPVTIITVGDGKRNGMTASDVGPVALGQSPPLVMVSISELHYTYDLIREYKEFAINTISANQAEVAEFFGSRSGKNIDKFKESSVETFAASKIKAPLLKESPICLECRVVAEYSSRYHPAKLIPDVDGSTSHNTMFIGEVVATHKNNDKVPIAWMFHKGSPCYLEISPLAREK